MTYPVSCTRCGRDVVRPHEPLNHDAQGRPFCVACEEAGVPPGDRLPPADHSTVRSKMTPPVDPPGVGLCSCGAHRTPGQLHKPGCINPDAPMPDRITDAMVEHAALEMASWSGPVPGGVDGFRPYARKVLLAALADERELVKVRCDACRLVWHEDRSTGDTPTSPYLFMCPRCDELGQPKLTLPGETGGAG